ncbi:hypothetical protein QYE76_035592 [Lolium multiflorum]|uniref:CCHC-type domain-containing protein n=1 Tax=Lolium multiflorum TaxID=4521 RepID=A0AAD8R1X4_LOLMU|nr:hypothetical protein QYE76_035592 [Lolium multiflorum]
MGGPNPSLEDLLQSLKIKGDDLGGIFVPKAEVEALKEDSKWMAVLKVLTTKTFSAASLKQTLCFAWAPAQEITFRDLENSSFIVQAKCLRDWQRITDHGPWLFREQGVLIEKYDGCCKAMSVELNMIHAWVQIHDVPELFRKKHIMTDLAAKVGQLLAVDMTGGEFARARVWLDVRKPLTRFVTTRPKEESPVFMRVKYEKIPKYCAVCGFLGHVKEECGSGEHPLEAEGFGTWLLADTLWNRGKLQSAGEGLNKPARRDDRSVPGAGGRDGRSARGEGGRGRGRGSGRGRSEALQGMDNRKRNSAEAKLSEVSPVKDANTSAAPLMLEWKSASEVGVAGEKGARKQLEFEVQEAEKVYTPLVGTPPPPPSAREKKCSKKHTQAKQNLNSTVMAGSAVEHRPIQ